jgi:hypothetical protein
VSVFFYLRNNIPAYAVYELSIVDESGNSKGTCSSMELFEPNFGWGSSEFISRNDLFKTENGLIKDNTLTLTGKFKFINESKFVRETAKLEENNRLQVFFHNRSLADLEIKIQGKSIKAHRVLVAASSPILAGCLFELEESQTSCGNRKQKRRTKNKKKGGSKRKTKTKNSSPNILEIDDLEFEVAEEMVNFIYDGEVKDMKKYAKSLLEAADKFKMAQLKVCCEKYLFENLTVGNAIETFKVSRKCHAVELRVACLDFIVE